MIWTEHTNESFTFVVYKLHTYTRCNTQNNSHSVIRVIHCHFTIYKNIHTCTNNTAVYSSVSDFLVLSDESGHDELLFIVQTTKQIEIFLEFQIRVKISLSFRRFFLFQWSFAVASFFSSSFVVLRWAALITVFVFFFEKNYTIPHHPSFDWRKKKKRKYWNYFHFVRKLNWNKI